MSNEFKDGEEERLLSEREKILADEEVKRSLLGPGRAQYAKKPKREFDFEAWRSWVASRYREPFDPEKEWRTFWFRDVAREGSVAAPSSGESRGCWSRTCTPPSWRARIADPGSSRTCDPHPSPIDQS